MLPCQPRRQRLECAALPRSPGDHCGRVSRQRWGVVGGWKAGKWWGEGQTQRKVEALGFELAGGCHNQRSMFVMVPPPTLSFSLQSIRTMWGQTQRRILSSCLWSSQTKTTSGFLSTEPFSGESRWVPPVWNVTTLGIIPIWRWWYWETGKFQTADVLCRDAFYSIPQFIILPIPPCISHYCTGLIVASWTTFESCDQVGRKESRSINKRRVFSAHDVLILMNLLHGTNLW